MMYTRTSGLGAASKNSSIIGASVSATLETIAPMTAPFIAAVGAIAGPVLALFGGCGQTCTQATAYANQAADALQQIDSQYWAQPVRTVSMQAAALQAMQQIFDALQQGCGNPALGDPGKRCISERLVRGGTAPWCPNPGHTGCDWWTVHYDPIANDPDVVPDPGSVSLLPGGNVLSRLNLPLVLGIGLIGLGLAVES